MRNNLRICFQEFIRECEFVKRLSPQTIKSYSDAFSTFEKLMPGVTTESLTPYAVTDFFKNLQERKRIVGAGMIRTGVKNSTVDGYWRKLSAFFEWLLLRRHIVQNPLKGMRHPTVSYDDAKYLKKNDVERILAAIHSASGDNPLLFKRNIVFFYLLMFCGLRKGELSLLQVRDIDFERRLLTVRKETCKSGRVRQIPLHPTAIMHLLDYLRQRRHLSTQYLFVSTTRDDRLSDGGLRHLVDAISKRSGVRFHLHQFRHTFAVNYLKATQSLPFLKDLLGHRDIRITARYLRAISVDETRQGIESLQIDGFMR